VPGGYLGPCPQCEGNGYVTPSDRVLDKLRVLCERDIEEVLSDTHHDRMVALQAEDLEEVIAGPSMDLVEQYVGRVRDFHRQVACRGRRSDPTCGLCHTIGSPKEHKLRDCAFFAGQRRARDSGGGSCAVE
jgi:hypothetical protein